MMWRLAVTFWKTKRLPVSLKFSTFPSLYDQALGGDVKGSFLQMWKHEKTWSLACLTDESLSQCLFFAKEAALTVCWWDLAQVTAPAGAPSQQGKKIVFSPPQQHCSWLWDMWTDTLAGLQHPLTPSMVYFPILRNFASFPGRLKHVLDGFISWWWCTQAYPHTSCFCFKTFSYLISLSTSLWQHCRDFHEWLLETSLITHRLTWKP